MKDSDPVQIDVGSAKRLDAMYKAFKAEPAQLRGDINRTPQRQEEIIFASLNEYQEGDYDAEPPVADSYSWSEVRKDSTGEWVVREGGRTGLASTADPINQAWTQRKSWKYPVTGAASYVVLKRSPVAFTTEGEDDEEDTTEYKPCWIIVTPPPTPVIVALVSDGGGSGDPDSAPTWTYSVTDAITDIEIETGAAPDGKRFDVPCNEADYGIGYFNVDEDFVLVWTNETPITTGVCPDPPPEE